MRSPGSESAIHSLSFRVSGPLPARPFKISWSPENHTIESYVLLDPGYDARHARRRRTTSSCLIHTDEGITGIGEVDTNPWVAQAMIHARGTHVLGLGLEEMLLGEDPLQPEALWDKLYTGSLMTGRRGLGICAMGALDMALWDIRQGARHAVLEAARRRAQAVTSRRMRRYCPPAVR